MADTEQTADRAPHDCYMDSCGASTMPGVACGDCCSCLGSCVQEDPHSDTEQDGVSPATAGGAPAPDLRALADVIRAAFSEAGAEFAGLLTARFGSRCDCQITPQPDPRDAEIERLRGLVAEMEASRDRGFTRYAELLNPIREVFGKSPVGASHYRELRDGINRLIVSCNAEVRQHDQTKAERDRLRAEHSNADFLQSEADHWRQAYDTLNAAVSALVGEHRQTKNLLSPEPPVGTRFVQAGGGEWTRKDDGWHCSREGCVNCPAGWDEVYDRVQDAVRHLPGAKPAKPAEPRRWHAGDPEPEIGTTLRYVSDTHRPGFTRRTDGSWHCNTWSAHDPNACDRESWTWERITSDTSRMPLVEVVSTDG